MDNPEKNSIGGAVGTIIIILLLIVGGWYFFSNQLEKIEEKKKNAPIIETSEMSTSTEVSDIESDLNKIDTDSLDQE